MAELTVRQVLLRLDALLPNQYTAEEKREWLQQAEDTVLREVIDTNDGTVSDLPRLTENSALTVPEPYSEMYRYYIEAQIHYANGEINRYNNAAAAWNSALTAFRDYYCRTHLPCRRSAALHVL